MKNLTFLLLLLCSAAQSQSTFALEHFFDQMPLVERVQLPFSGEKYVYQDYNKVRADLFNADFTPWKSLQAPLPYDGFRGWLGYLSENHFNNDPLLEATYTISDAYEIACPPVYTGIVDENGKNIPLSTAGMVKAMPLPGKPVTLLWYKTLYQMPNMTPLHVFPREVRYISRLQSEKYGEVYAVLLNDESWVNLYDSGFNVLKTISVDNPDAVIQLSGADIVADDKVELAYYLHGQDIFTVKNEDNTVPASITFPAASTSATVHQMPGEPTKIMVNFADGVSVYSFPGLQLEHAYPNHNARLGVAPGEVCYHWRDDTDSKVFLHDREHQLYQTIPVPEAAKSVHAYKILMNRRDFVKDDNMEFIAVQRDGAVAVVNEDNDTLAYFPGATDYALSIIAGLPAKLLVYYKSAEKTGTEVYRMPEGTTSASDPKAPVATGRVFPNPFSDRITLADIPAGASRVRLIDAQGRVVAEQGIEGSPVVLQNLAVLPAGSYFLEWSGLGVMETIPMVKR